MSRKPVPHSNILIGSSDRKARNVPVHCDVSVVAVPIILLMNRCRCRYVCYVSVPVPSCVRMRIETTRNLGCVDVNDFDGLEGIIRLDAEDSLYIRRLLIKDDRVSDRIWLPSTVGGIIFTSDVSSSSCSLGLIPAFLFVQIEPFGFARLPILFTSSVFLPLRLAVYA